MTYTWTVPQWRWDMNHTMCNVVHLKVSPVNGPFDTPQEAVRDARMCGWKAHEIEVR